ncbi:MAG: hypothetical protein MUP44_12670, partial [Anaerolineales bacterium]|nr:hypothetical protein [Anaerolineales bacterium]
DAFEFHFVRRPKAKARLRLAGGKSIGSLQPAELLELYWQAAQLECIDTRSLKRLAEDIFHAVTLGEDPERTQ